MQMNMQRNHKPTAPERTIIAFGLVLVMIGSGIGLYSWGEFELGKRLRQHGSHTPGRVTAIRAERSLVVAYTYAVGAKEYTNRATLRGEIGSTIGPGASVDVVYLPSDPSQSLCSLESLDSPGDASTNRGIAIALAVVGALFMWTGIGSGFRQKPT